VLTNVSLVDVESGAVVPDAAVVVRGDRVVSAGPRDALRIQRFALRIDGEGGFVIPGLWDMHVHLTDADPEALPLMIANGVTGVRDMGGSLAVVDSFRTAILAGEMPGPRIVRSGRVVDGNKYLADRYILETPDEGRAAVAELLAAGVDHIKIHNGLPREVFFAVARATAEGEIPLVGHVPMEVYPAEAIDAGLSSVEHIATIFEGKVAGHLRDPFQQLQLMRDFAVRGADTLATHFVESGAWFTPTLVAYGVNSRLAELADDPDPRRRYVSGGFVAHWDENFPIQPYELDPRIVALRLQGDSAFAAVVSTFAKHGVGLLVGTDLGTREIYPGFSVHDELALLVERVGLSPLEALRAATLNPARYLGADSLGTVAAGKVADFVVLEGNPLDDIGNTRRIRGVVFNGKFFARAQLDGMHADVEHRVQEYPPEPRPDG
jgi:hypothetical protein